MSFVTTITHDRTEWGIDGMEKKSTMDSTIYKIKGEKTIITVWFVGSARLRSALIPPDWMRWALRLLNGCDAPMKDWYYNLIAVGALNKNPKQKKREAMDFDQWTQSTEYAIQPVSLVDATQIRTEF